MDIKIINQKLDEADGKFFLPFRIIYQKWKNDEVIDWSYLSDLNNWSLLEDGRPLFKDDPEPYDVQPSPEFLAKQKEEIEAEQRRIYAERIKTEAQEIEIKRRMKEKLDTRLRNEVLVDMEKESQKNVSSPEEVQGSLSK